ncbi:electron transfer flavoprotein subunit alpha/FixB family protein [Thiohalorhabdus sp. Cl-TMA]|uniref:Electron transfer flavoprotein subunit alpha/FixB family protein n=1 Tax=Thiohalorhabdus methylotrophus TaxID=3242694 RepID=A0ABV4TV54_9GAMM
MSGILVVAEHRQGELSDSVPELVGLANGLKEGLGGPLMVAVIAQDPSAFSDQVNLAGVDEIVQVPVSVAEFQPDVWEAALQKLVAEKGASVVMTPHSVDGWGYAPTLAAANGYGFASDVLETKVDGGEVVAVRPGYGEKVHMEVGFPGKDAVVLTVRSGEHPVVEESGSAEVTTAEAPDVTPRSEHKRFIEPESGGGVDLSQEEFIMSIGRGISDEENVEQFSELAEEIGAALGCSRPIADNGWLPKAHQVGQSGTTASNCKFYLALGISGSVQHQAGMKHVDSIVAVNTDPEAPIFSVAKYGVVADIFDIAEELRPHFE